MSQDTIEGYVDHIIFRNEDNGYTVLNLIVKGSEVTCVGTFEYVGEGELLELHGFYVDIEYPISQIYCVYKDMKLYL